MDNFTLQEEPFGELNLEEIETAELYNYPENTWRILNEIIQYGIIGASVLGCVILIYVITKFDYLKTRTNIYVYHYAIASIPCYLCTPVFNVLMSLGLHQTINSKVACAVYAMFGSSAILMLMFGTAFAVDWLIVMLKVTWLEKYGQIQKYIIAIIYLVNVTAYICSVVECFVQRKTLSGVFVVIQYCILAVIVISVDCITFFRKLSQEWVQYKYSLIISNIIVLSWLPMLLFYELISHLYYSYFREHNAALMFIVVMENLLKYLMDSIPLVTAIFLGNLNHGFRRAYNTVFKWPAKKYSQEDLDEDEENVLIESDRGGNGNLLKRI